MEDAPTPFITIKTTTLRNLLALAVILGVAVIFADDFLSLSSDRHLAAVGIFVPGTLITVSLGLYVSGAVTKVKPYTAYVEADPDQDCPLQQGRIIFDNNRETTCLCYPPLSGQEIKYFIPDIPLDIKSKSGETIVKYEVGWEGRLRELFAVQRLAVGNNPKLKESRFYLQQNPALWFERWVRYKNNELQDYIASLEERTGSFEKWEIEQKVGLSYTMPYERFGLKLKFTS